MSGEHTGSAEMPGLHTIVYVSSATWLMTQQDLEYLLVAARDLNLQNAVTGVLLYSDGNFMQCFEGTQEAVMEAYGHILASARHRNVIELLNEPIEARSFPDWQMGFSQPTHAELERLLAARWESRDGDVQAASPERATSPGLVLLQSFWKNIRR